MEKKYQVLYIWSFIIVAGIVLLLLYTPIGGSLHQSNDITYYSYNTGVDFGGKITNSPKIKASQTYVQSEEEIKSSVDLPKFNASNSKRGRVNSNNSESNYSVIVNTKPDIQGGGGGGGFSSPIFASKGDKNGGTGSFMVGTSNNQLFASESNNTTSVIQKGTQGVSDVVDPGGGDPGNMIPVGDGLPVLLVFAMIYFTYKRTFLKD